jgi:hypothetical protein
VRRRRKRKMSGRRVRKGKKRVRRRKRMKQKEEKDNCRCKKQALAASKAQKETPPRFFAQANFDQFKTGACYESLLQSHPALMYALAGTAMTNQPPSEIQVACFFN